VAFDRGAEGEADWNRITEIMSRLFLVSLNKPQMVPTRGSFILTYKQQDIDNDLEISLAGRGMQQILLILAFLFWHKNSIILVDEPDAHLEILRQKQVYDILNHLAAENNSQIIIATHSEAILDEAVETNLTLLLHGKAVNMANDARVGTHIRNSLQNYGIEHYYKAKLNPRILIVEGSTDKEILKEFAKHLDHEKAYSILDDRLNVYYTQDTYPGRNFDSDVARASGSFRNLMNYYQALKYVIPGLKAFAIYDKDKFDKQDEQTSDYTICYWQKYEIENYFISPKVLIGEFFFEVRKS
jgi:ABC-type glutathione transport system ATPase component